MESDPDVDAFEAAVEAHDGTVSRSLAAEFGAAIEAVIETPAVGVAVSLSGVSLTDSNVDLTPSPSALDAARTGITPAKFGIETLGTVFLESRSAGDEPVSLFPERHIAVLAASDIAPDLETAFDRLEEEFANGSMSGVLASGPSATADMGATVQGVHGPSEVHVLVVTDR
ncbi:MAG: LUD domain-containing protein [Halodesulfurarchaeum sp.]|nr:LUD domain-containing protein [Halodesulfurarchaeum sp.]